MAKKDFSRRVEQAMAYAKELRRHATSWTEIHNALYGIGGKLGELFPTQQERVAFGKSPECREIARMMDGLRDEAGDPVSLVDVLANVNGTISVRLPKSIHAALLAEAKVEDVSLNQLCVSKLAMQLRPMCVVQK